MPEYCLLLSLKHYFQFSYLTSKGGTSWWLKGCLASTKPQTSCKLSILVYMRYWVTTQVFEPSTKVSVLFLETSSNSQAFICMTRIHLNVSYKYLATHPQNIITLPLYIFIALKPRTSYYLTKHINLIIHMDLLCNTIISIIHAKIALCSHGLSSAFCDTEIYIYLAGTIELVNVAPTWTGTCLLFQCSS